MTERQEHSFSEFDQGVTEFQQHLAIIDGKVAYAPPVQSEVTKKVTLLISSGHENVLGQDPEALGTLSYLIDTIPATFPNLRITTDAKRDEHSWIKREDLEKSLEGRSGNATDHIDSLNYLESSEAIKPRLKGNDASVIYSLIDTVTAIYALKLQRNATNLSDIPREFWPALRNLIEEEVENKRNENQFHISHNGTKDQKKHYSRFSKSTIGELTMARARKIK